MYWGLCYVYYFINKFKVRFFEFLNFRFQLLYSLSSFLWLFFHNAEHLLFLESRLNYLVIFILKLIEIIFEFLIFLWLWFCLTFQLNNTIFEDLIWFFKIIDSLFINSDCNVFLLKDFLIFLDIDQEILWLFVYFSIFSL